MGSSFRRLSSVLLVIILMVSTSGCTFIFQKGRRVDSQKISKLKRELTDMERAKLELEDRLKNEIDDSEVKVEMMNRGLVITFMAEVLFDSGKAELRESSLGKLAKVARVLNTTIKDLNLGIEGHTDNVPIKYSGWKSNWELSVARSLSVVHFLSEKQNVSPTRLAAIGYGEYHPIDSNKTAVGKARNRRVEIVILPKELKKIRK